MKPFSDFVIRFRVPIVIATLVLTVVLGFFIKDTRVNSDIMSYLPSNDPAVELNRHIGESFGGTDMAVVALETDDVFTPEGLSLVASITTRLGLIDGVRSVTSLTNVLDIKKIDDGLEVGMLIEPGAIPRTMEEARSLREYALSDEMFRGRLVSEDGKATLIAARLASDADKPRVAEDIRAAIDEMRIEEKVYYAGMPFQLFEINRIVVDDMVRLIPLAALLIVGALLASFRSLRGVLLPLLAVGISAVWVIGIMAIFNVEFSLVTNVIPVVLMAAGSAYAIHVVSAFNEEASEADRLKGSRKALSQVALPVVLAAVTTMAGFLSFIFGSYLTMIREFGLFTSLGILFALVISLTFIPALLSFMPDKPPARSRASGALPATPGVFRGLGHLVLKHNKIVIVAFAIITVGCVIAMPFVKREVDILSYFKKDTEIRKAEDFMAQRFGGSMSIQVLVKGDIKDPSVLGRMKSMEKLLRGQPGLSNVSSIVEVIEKMNDAMTDEPKIPDSRDMVANLWFLLEGDEMVESLVSPNADEAVISATLEKLNSRELAGIVARVGDWAQANSTEECSFQLSGIASIYQKIDSALASSQLWSLIFATGFMFLCNLFLLRSLSGSLIGLIPIIFTLFVLFGVMGVAGIPVDIATVLIGSISLGMGIDYSIHFLSRYRRELSDGRDRTDALAVTLNTTGKSIFINVATVSIGFLALLLGNFIPLRRFGILIAATMVSSGLASLTLLPAVMFLAPAGAFRKAAQRIRELGAALRASLKARLRTRLEKVRIKSERSSE